MTQVVDKTAQTLVKSNGTSNIAVRVENLGKCYHIYDKPQHRLIQSFLWGKKQLYRDFWALKDVSFEVRKGETVGIIGPNGSGKSTLLQLICGTLTPTLGDIEINGRIASLLELGSGFNCEFTGRENIYINASLLGLSRLEIEAKYEDIVAFADIEDFIYQPMKTYSSGMVMRLAFAVIAHVDADILVIDEALAVGDAFFTQKCMRFLRKFREQGTLLFVSHDSTAVVNICHQAIWLDQGKIRMLGTAKDTCERYLTSIYETQQGPSSVFKRMNPKQDDRTISDVQTDPRVSLKDQRLEFINQSWYRNDIELFTFNTDAPSFGKGGARICSVTLLDINSQSLSWIVGGEIVTLVVQAQSFEVIEEVIVGFIVKDRLGQALFGDNTYLTYRTNPKSIRPGEKIEVQFQFQMPILPAGDYSMTVAIAEGSQSNHVQHQWIHDALMFKSHSSSVCTGLVGIPMLDIKLKIDNHEL